MGVRKKSENRGNEVNLPTKTALLQRNLHLNYTEYQGKNLNEWQI